LRRGEEAACPRKPLVEKKFSGYHCHSDSATLIGSIRKIVTMQ
jgi:hypothetical protein